MGTGRGGAGRHLKQHAVLLDSPRILANVVVQMVVPAFAALLTRSAWQLLRHESPAARAMHAYEVPHRGVLLLCPLFTLRAIASASVTIVRTVWAHLNVHDIPGSALALLEARVGVTSAPLRPYLVPYKLFRSTRDSCIAGLSEARDLRRSLRDSMDHVTGGFFRPKSKPGWSWR